MSVALPLGLGAYVLTQGCDIGRTHSILLDGGATEAQCVTHFHPFPRSSFTLFPTFCGLQPLPGRTTLVLSRSGVPIPGVTVIRSLDEIAAAAPSAPEIVVCGGAEIYALTQSRWQEVFVTRVKRTVADGDVFFPEFEAQFAAPEVVRDTPEFTILHYRR